MSNRIASMGLVTLTVAASDKLAIFSRTPVKVYQSAGYPNQPESWTPLSAIAAETEYVSSAFSAATGIRIEAGEAEVLYATGTDAVITERRGQRGQGTPGVLNATGALTAAMVASGIVTSTTGAAVAGTTPTGAVLDAALDMEIGESFDFTIIATGANAFTLTAGASGVTIVGTAVVATVTSGTFRCRKTAADTFIFYRL